MGVGLLVGSGSLDGGVRRPDQSVDHDFSAVCGQGQPPGVITAECRYRLALNSFLFGFVDGGWAKNKYQLVDVKNTFIGSGLGLQFETKFGLLNISYAIGKRDDVKFSIRESSKIHFGYINYF